MVHPILERNENAMVRTISLFSKKKKNLSLPIGVFLTQQAVMAICQNDSGKSWISEDASGKQISGTSSIWKETAEADRPDVPINHWFPLLEQQQKQQQYAVRAKPVKSGISIHQTPSEQIVLVAKGVGEVNHPPGAHSSFHGWSHSETSRPCRKQSSSWKCTFRIIFDLSLSDAHGADQARKA